MSESMTFRGDRAAARRDARTDGRDRRLPPDYKEALPAAELPPEIAAGLESARVDTSEPYELDDLPEIDEAPDRGSPRT